jgi:hypothetical protein
MVKKKLLLIHLVNFFHAICQLGRSKYFLIHLVNVCHINTILGFMSTDTTCVSGDCGSWANIYWYTWSTFVTATSFSGFLSTDAKCMAGVCAIEQTFGQCLSHQHLAFHAFCQRVPGAIAFSIIFVGQCLSHQHIFRLSVNGYHVMAGVCSAELIQLINSFCLSCFFVNGCHLCGWWLRSRSNFIITFGQCFVTSTPVVFKAFCRRIPRVWLECAQ